ncbi:MAG TPA: hypothetical protein VFH51_06865 [Myxococcota bacterium]|nr:hypothetical protein [Myxococcota bacterium]
MEALKKKQQELEARIKREEAIVRTRERKRDTRRKVLLGALLEQMMSEDAKLKALVDRRLREGFLEKRIDFEVFDLEVPAHVAAKDRPPMEEVSAA